MTQLREPAKTAGLTTTEAPFIEEAREKGQFYIFQPYDLYSEENHESWRRLYARMAPQWERYANEHFRKGIASLCLDPERVPRLEDVNRFLKPLTGFQAKAVSGYVPAFMFFDCLRNREFPTTIKALARFFWFTIEFGLMRGKDGLRVYGSGLLSSYGEISHSIDSDEVQRYPIQLEWVINQGFEIDHYQPLLFIVDSFDHLFDLVDRLERWMRDGKLNNVAPGEPQIDEHDVESFVAAGSG